MDSLFNSVIILNQRVTGSTLQYKAGVENDQLISLLDYTVHMMTCVIFIKNVDIIPHIIIVIC